MTLRTECERASLPLADPFTISRGTTETVEITFVRITDDEGTTGLGGAAPASYYGETADTVASVLPSLLSVVETVDDPFARERIERRMRERTGDDPAARAAVSTALSDLAAARLGVPYYRLLGLDPDRAPPTSFTIGIDDPDRMHSKAQKVVAAGHRVLKVKLGDGPELDRERERLAAVREAAPDARIRVDANGAWTPDEAVELSAELARRDVEFVEQPVPAEDVEGLRSVRERGSVPVAADESVVTAADVPGVADAVDVVVAKLMKCGSPRETRRVAHVARAHGCEAMLGCMVESDASIAAAWHLAPLFDYADLDGSLLLGEDPVDGVPVEGGEAALASVDRGTGAVRSDD